MKSKKYKYIIGIDEAGRGPLAGPVSVGGICIPSTYSLRKFKGIKDSKQLTPPERDVWFDDIKKKSDGGILQYHYSFGTSESIDTHGIVPTVRGAINRIVNHFNVDPSDCLVLLDGGLYAPKKFIYQKTIIKGDEKEPLIALASIVAKVMRDRRMVRYGKVYPEYNFKQHKGYGTRQHVEAIREHGLSPIHRHTFIHF